MAQQSTELCGRSYLAYPSIGTQVGPHHDNTPTIYDPLLPTESKSAGWGRSTPISLYNRPAGCRIYLDFHGLTSPPKQEATPGNGLPNRYSQRDSSGPTAAWPKLELACFKLNRTWLATLPFTRRIKKQTPNWTQIARFEGDT